jgi:hypothetical protein
MLITTLFRTVLIAGLITAVVGVVAGISLSDTLPMGLQDYLAQSENSDISTSEAIFSIFALLAVLIILPVSTIGLWKFKRWARTLYVVLTIILIPFYPAMGPVVMNGWEAMFDNITLLLEGILIAMMFTGTISQEFQAVKIKKDS